MASAIVGRLIGSSLAKKALGAAVSGSLSAATEKLIKKIIGKGKKKNRRLGSGGHRGRHCRHDHELKSNLFLSLIAFR